MAFQPFWWPGVWDRYLNQLHGMYAVCVFFNLFLDCIIYIQYYQICMTKKTISQIHIHQQEYVHQNTPDTLSEILFFASPPRFSMKKNNDGACHGGPVTWCQVHATWMALSQGWWLPWFGDTFGWSAARGLINVFFAAGIQKICIYVSWISMVMLLERNEPFSAHSCFSSSWSWWCLVVYHQPAPWIRWKMITLC